MKVLESTIERLAWMLTLVILIVTVIVGIFAYNDGQLINQNVKIINSNFEAYIKCVEDEAYQFPPNVRPTQAQADTILNNCAAANTKPIKQ